jgi:serine/threonine protein kinase
VDIEQLLGALHGARDLLATSNELPKCGICQAQNTTTAAFCGACGARLTFPCPDCGHCCRSQGKYCPACGRELIEKDVVETIGKLKAAEQILASDPLRAFDELHKLSEQRSIRYRARRQGQDRFLKVAEKNPNRTLLRNDADALEGLEHPNVVRLLGIHEHRDRTLLELEWIDADALRFPLPIGRLIKLMLGLASALAALHQRGVVHCDVKPDNILIRKNDGSPVLIDFEAAQRRDQARLSGYTPMFAAPEQVFGDHVDVRADVYAFGMTLYLLFFYDRLPSILDPESKAQRAFEKILKARVKRSEHYLDNATLIPGFVHLADSEPEVERHLTMPKIELPINVASNQSEVLGAKYFFASELQRIADVNRRLDLTSEILSIIAHSTEVDPDRRPADGGELFTRMSKLANALGEDE